MAVAMCGGPLRFAAAFGAFTPAPAKAGDAPAPGAGPATARATATVSAAIEAAEAA